ncbi:MAG TPA: thiamine phosphate synthase [Candidatus Acidoferrum sp.]|nr:thiamine phosphate synthase [Candidatus Acidoferrum sp.]
MCPLPKPAQPILCYVTDRRSLPLSTSADAHHLLLHTIGYAAAAGVDWIQLREKDYSGQGWATLVRESLVRVKKEGSGSRILVNDRLDVALACGADGVHLSENGIPVAEACRLRNDFFAARNRPANFLVGLSCHSLGAALGAARAGADYIYFSPIFFTPSKANYGPPQGVERLARVCAAVEIPVIAIGGITAKNATECLQAGACGVAAIRLFQEPAEPLAQTISELHQCAFRSP